MKIYDCINFFNEFEILDLRFNILNEYVDYFVVVEASIKHNGEEKPFYFEENKKQFEPFLHKIIHYKITDTPNDFINLKETNDDILSQIYSYMRISKRFDRNTQPDYGRDWFQKESVRRALLNCKNEDVVLLSDADEIPSPVVLKQIHKLDIDNKIFGLSQNMYYFYLNVLKETGWTGTKLIKYKNLKDKCINEIRNDRSLFTIVEPGGWHFSFMGGIDKVKTKLLSYSARDMVNEKVLNSLENNIQNDIDPFFRHRLQKVPIDKSYPQYILNNLTKYKSWIKDYSNAA